MKFPKTSKQWFSCLSILLLLFLMGCASKRDIKKQEQSTPVSSESMEAKPLTAPEFSLEDIKVLKSAGHCRVKITTSTPPTYTVFKLSKPERLIIDLPEIQAAENPELIEVENDYITEIKTTRLQDNDRNFVRIEVGLKKDFAYNVSNENNSIFIDLSPQKVPGAEFDKKTEVTEPISVPEKTAVLKTDDEKNSIIAIKISQTADENKITIIAAYEIKKYNAYSMQHPNRLVIDIPGAKSLIKKPLLAVGSSMIDKVRVGRQREKVRIVIDILGEKFPPYQIAQEKNYLIVNIRSDKKTAAYEPRQAEETIKEGSPSEDTGGKTYSGEKISLDFKDADIKNVLRLISDISGLNVIISDNVAGNVTLKLVNIPWDEALDIILETNNLGRIDTRNITRIETMEQIRKLNHEKLLAIKSQEEIEDLVVKTFAISYAKSGDLVTYITKMKVLSSRGSVTDFKVTNKLTIQDIPAVVAKVEKLIQEQDIPIRQVMIEARIIQSNPSYVREMGLRWGGLYNTTHNGGALEGGSDISIGGSDSGVGGTAGNNYLINLPAAAGAGSGGAISFGILEDAFSLDLELTALENEDKIKIISHPRILTMDNKLARIKQGVALPYLKLSEQGVTSTEFKDAVLELSVLPKITPANTVALHVFVTKNQRSSQTGAGNEPGIDVREVETDLLIRNGDTVVIGGIYETTKSYSVKKVPFFGDLPYVGWAFRSEKEEDQIIELLVFITVTIVESPNNMAKDFNDISS